MTEARLTNDLREATVYYTVLGHAGGTGGDAPPRCTARPASSARRWAGSIGLRHTPSIEFVADALPDSARRIDDLVAAARQADEELARAREGATWAGDPDPYKKPAEARTTGRLGRRGRG